MADRNRKRKDEAPNPEGAARLCVPSAGDCSLKTHPPSPEGSLDAVLLLSFEDHPPTLGADARLVQNGTSARTSPVGGVGT